MVETRLSGAMISESSEFVGVAAVFSASGTGALAAQALIKVTKSRGKQTLFARLIMAGSSWSGRYNRVRQSPLSLALRR